MRADKQATLAKHFLDFRSYVAPDGREVLYGDDWDARIEELRIRCKGRCEQWEEKWPDVRKCLSANFRCERDAQDPHHIIRRSVKRDDRLENLQALCRYHHDLLDRRKPQWREHADDVQSTSDQPEGAAAEAPRKGGSQ